MSLAASPSKTGHSIAVTLMPIMAAVLAGFLVIGLALPVLPLHVSNDLGFGTFVVGLVAGAQFAASLISRVPAGSFSDKYGAKCGVVTGLITAVIAGFLYLLSLAFIGMPVLSVAILLLGRGVLGGAESFIITGGVTWGLGLVAHEHSRKVIAWVGTASEGAFMNCTHTFIRRATDNGMRFRPPYLAYCCTNLAGPPPDRLRSSTIHVLRGRGVSDSGAVAAFEIVTVRRKERK